MYVYIYINNERLYVAEPGFDSWLGKGFIFSAVSVSDRTKPPIPWVLGQLSPGIKRLEHEAHTHFQLTSRSKCCNYTSTPSRLHAYCLII